MNKVILKGRLMADPEVRTGKTGDFCTCRLSTAEKRNGEWVYDNHNVAFFGKNAENVPKILRKGSNVIVEGKIKYTKRGDADNQVWYTNIEAFYFESCDPYQKKENHEHDYKKDDIPF